MRKMILSLPKGAKSRGTKEQSDCGEGLRKPAKPNYDPGYRGWDDLTVMLKQKKTQ
ncbi:MAG: hypothetical protein ABIH85_04940 [Candidatus Omnitrophota bacterium]|nr:hypothetical protein [Candidatus Omnitrophota bacterium]